MYKHSTLGDEPRHHQISFHRVSMLAISATHADVTVVHHRGTGEYFSFGNVGSEIWRLLQEGMRDEEIASEIATKFDVDRPTAARDVATFVIELRQRELIV